METSTAKPSLKRVAVTGRKTARLATETCGEGPPFVWGHSLLGSMKQDLDGGVLAWRDLTDMAQLIRYDARGHGRSEHFGAPEDFRWDNLARNMWQVIDSYTDQQVVLGGASMGCATSLHAACQRPHRVRGLVLVIPPTAWQWREKMKRNYRIAANIARYTRGVPFRLLGHIPLQRSDTNFQKDMLSVLLRELSKMKTAGLVGALQGASLSDLPPRQELEKLQIPTIILAWPDDATHPLAVAEELHNTMPDTRLEVVKQADEPYQWPRLVRQFITALD